MTEKKAIELSGLSPAEIDLARKKLGRNLSVEEIGMFGALWSEHCGYKNTKPLIKKLPVTGKHLLQGPGENAGVVSVDDYAIAFKIESHNHPSAVEPYEGAATGVGGILRDVFAMGARPIAVLDSLRFGKRDSARTRFLVGGIINGISDYGNRVGIPTVAGEVVFEDQYEGNPLVNVMCVGIAKKDKIIKATAKGKGNLLFYYGSKTGRDGLGGATFASAELSSEGEDKRPSVQVGDAFTEKLILEATLELLEKKLVIGIQDMGAAGITSSSVEMAGRGNSGIEIDIDQIPARAANMSAYEFLLSESQERMLACIEPSRLEACMEVMKKWELDCAVIGRVTDSQNVVVKENGKVLADIPTRFLLDEVPFYEREVKRPAYLEKAASIPPYHLNKTNNEMLKDLLSDVNIASKKWVYERYDHMVQTNLLAQPCAAGGALLRIKGTSKAIAMATDGNGRYTYLNPSVGGMQAVAEVARNLACMGAETYGITNCLNFGNPEKSEVYYQLAKAMEGMGKACKALNVPITGGNASLYNETDGEPILPTITVGAVGIVDNYKKAVTAAFQKEGHLVGLLGINKEEIGGSLYLEKACGKIAGKCPSLDMELEVRLQRLIRELISKSFIASAQDVSDGGLSVALCESAILSGKGVSIRMEEELSSEALLFGESQSRIVISFDPKKQKAIEKMAKRFNIPFQQIGFVSEEKQIRIANRSEMLVGLSLEEAEKLYQTSYL